MIETVHMIGWVWLVLAVAFIGVPLWVYTLVRAVMVALRRNRDKASKEMHDGETENK